mmetsp:Transcript_4989/g.12864  ORF Transcript_4989/g.12864 Transcript_4989/m.12864 type:complete len:226 (-) Transcript_4989:1046-1723(-)
MRARHMSGLSSIALSDCCCRLRSSWMRAISAALASSDFWSRPSSSLRCDSRNSCVPEPELATVDVSDALPGRMPPLEAPLAPGCLDVNPAPCVALTALIACCRFCSSSSSRWRLMCSARRFTSRSASVTSEVCIVVLTATPAVGPRDALGCIVEASGRAVPPISCACCSRLRASSARRAACSARLSELSWVSEALRGSATNMVGMCCRADWLTLAAARAAADMAG